MNRDCITHTISKNVKILSFQIATANEAQTIPMTDDA